MYKKFDTYYGFDVKYVGQFSMSDEEQSLNNSDSSNFYKSLDPKNTYVLSVNDYLNNKSSTPVGTLYNNYIFANEKYIKDIINIDVKKTSDKELNIYVPNTMESEIEDIKNSTEYKYRDELKKNIVFKYNIYDTSDSSKIILLDQDNLTTNINAPIIIQDNYEFQDTFYQPLLTQKSVYTKLVSDNPYEKILPQLKKYNMNYKILALYTPYNKVLKRLQELQNIIVVTVIMSFILIITLILATLNITKILFVKRGKEYTLKYVSGVPTYKIFKNLFIDDLIYILLYLFAIAFIPVEYQIQLMVLGLIVSIDIVVKIFEINKNLKSSINNLIKGEL